MRRLFRRGVALPAVGALTVAALLSGTGQAVAKPPKPPEEGGASSSGSTGTGGSFTFGQLNWGAGCGSNQDGEPAVRVGRDGNVIVSSERGLGNGSDAWHGAKPGGTGASACTLSYSGQPNAVAGLGASGGDTDVAIASLPVSPSGPDRVYVASLNVGSVSVAHSDDGGKTYVNVPVQSGLPGDDREWIAAYGSSTSLLTFHDLATTNINVLRSDNGGFTYTQIGEALNPSSQAGVNGLLTNQHGNIAIDRVNTAGTTSGLSPGFWAYQSYVAPSTDNTTTPNFNEAYVAVSNDGGFNWTDREVPCSKASPKLNLGNQFPNVSVDPSGKVWLTWSAGTTDDNGNVTSGTVYAAVSADHGTSWTCSGAIAGGGKTPAVMPWIAATSAGVDLVFYQASGGPAGTWSAVFVQSPASAVTDWRGAQSITTVHKGAVCEAGFTCQSSRQLFDDFGVATDQFGWAHIAYSHDAPRLGGSGTYTGYAVQTAGTHVGQQN